MSIYIDRCPGIMADRRTADEAAALRYDAWAISDGSARAEAAIAVSWTRLSNTAAQPYHLRNGDPARCGPSRCTALAEGCARSSCGLSW